MKNNRRNFIKITGLAGISLAVTNPLLACTTAGKTKLKFGLVTYLWGKDWDLPTLIANCEETGVLGIELHTTCSWRRNKP